MADSPDTLLVLAGMGVPQFSARGLKQTLSPISLIIASTGTGGTQRRTVNGTLINLAPPQFQKYASRITAKDQEPPALDTIWPGTQLIVDCVTELSYPFGGTPSREVVEGSLRLSADGNFYAYRPRLTMLVQNFDVDKDEWGAEIGWTLDLEEEG